jgi:hypothetical protein
MRLLIAALVLLSPIVFGAVSLRETTAITLLRGTTTVETLTSWDACLARAKALANASTATSGTVTYTCQTEKRRVIASYAPNPVDCAVSAWSTWSGGTWSACVNGSQTRQETRARTVTTQPAYGGAACPALTESRTATQPCTLPGTAVLRWTVPTQNMDGSTLTNLAGYRIAYGTAPGVLHQSIQVANPGVTTHTVGNLAPATYYFQVRAYNSTGAESDPTNTATKVVQ